MIFLERDVLLTAGAIAVSVFIAYKQSQEKKPRYCLTSRTVVDRAPMPLGDLPGLTIQYDGQPVDKLQLTEILFWNDGRPTIRREDLDVAKVDTLRVCLTSTGRLFEHRYDAPSKNGVNIVRQGDVLDINFLYLDHGDGFSLTVTHFGELSLRGEIQGTSGPKLTEKQPGCLTIALILSLIPIATIALFLDLGILAAVSWALFFISGFYYGTKNPLPRKFRRYLALHSPAGTPSPEPASGVARDRHSVG
jgi:hypothetical protein